MRMPSIPWSKILVESILIVFSVLLALYIGRWNDQAKAVELERAALTAIEQEIAGNQTEASAKSTYHAALIEAISSRADTADLRLLPSFFRNSAWTMATGSQALIALPYDIRLRLASIYALQGSYDNMWRTALQVLYLNNVYPSTGRSREQFLRSWLPMLQDLRAMEHQLDTEYSAVLPLVHGWTSAH